MRGDIVAAPKTKAKPGDNGKLIAENRKARHNYAIEEKLEAGLVLTGTEVKSLRSGQANIAESYASPEKGEIWLINSAIPPYPQAHEKLNHEERRPRKLLLKKREMEKLKQARERQGMTIVPLRLFFNDRGIAKLQIGVAKGKNVADKRMDSKKRDWQRDKARLMRDKG